MHILFILQTAFSLFMLYDAVTRNADRYWWIIVMFPFGEWIYFFAVYRHSSQFKAFFGSLWDSSPSLAKIEYEARLCSSYNNRMLLAEALFAADRTKEAAPLFQALLDEDPDSQIALYKLALCQLELSQSDPGIENLRRIVDKQMNYADYEAAEALVHALYQAGRKDECISFLRDLIQRCHRPKLKCYLANTLAQEGEADEAKRMLDEIIEDHQHARLQTKWENRRWVGGARRLRQSLEEARGN